MNNGASYRSMPLVSVIVPTFNRCEILKDCLSALAAQDFPFGDFEIIVVDDGSSDNTAEAVRQVNSRFEIRYIHQRNSGPAAARNNGARHARGDLLLILNDDAVPFPNLVAGHYYMHKQMPRGEKLAVLGTREYRDRDKLLTLNFLYDQVPFSMRVYGLKEGFYPAAFFVTFNISLRKKDFETLGGFDEDFPSAIAEDTEFGIRWENSGGKIFFMPRLRAHHVHDVTVDGLKSMITREVFNCLILINKQRAHWPTKATDLLFQPESVMLDYVEANGPVMRQLETALRECEGRSIWEMEGRDGAIRVDCITDLVLAVRRLYPKFHSYVVLRRYLDDPDSRAMVQRWALTSGSGGMVPRDIRQCASG